MAATTTSTTDEPAGKPPPRPGKVKRETGGIEVLQKKGPKMKLEMEGGEDIIAPPTAAAPATAAAGALASAPGKRGSVDGSSPQKKRRVARGAKKSPTIKVEQQQQQQQPDVDTDGSSAPDAPVARVAAVAAEGAVPVGGSKAKATKKQQTKSAAKKPAARTKGGISSNGAAAGGKKVTAKAKTSGDRSSEVQPPLATPLRLAKGRAIKMVLDHLYPEPPIPLDFQDNFTFLCAVMLSAQTTDGKVNEVTGGSDGLFAIAPDAQTLSTLDHSTVLEIIRPVGLAPTKAKNLINMSALICSEFDGKVPDSYEGLESLPGVGHKTASVVMSQAFGEVGFAVDTHIHRQAVRWGLTVRKEEKDVKKVEEALKATFAREDWGKLHLQLIYFGREFCPAKKHTPAECPICCWINKAGRVSSGGGNGATSADGGGEGGEGGKGGSGIPGSIEDVPAEALQSTGKKAGKHIILYRERVEQIEARNGQTRPSSSEPAKRMDKNDDSVGVKAT